MSNIEWTNETWNPVTGCRKVSPGCKHCYAEKMHSRLHKMGLEKYKEPFTTVVMHEGELQKPSQWKKPRLIFVNSMSDLFHGDVSDEFIIKVFQVMRENPQHIFQVLTKRYIRLAEMDNAGLLEWAPNIWMGVSVENDLNLVRAFGLALTKAHVIFLSCEPLLGSLSSDYPLELFDWVIVGGESGPNARPMNSQWVLDIQEQCKAVGVPFFFKQWGGTNKKRSGNLLNGQVVQEWPRAYYEWLEKGKQL